LDKWHIGRPGTSRRNSRTTYDTRNHRSLDSLPTYRPSDHNARMRLQELHVGCFGGGTGLPSLLGGLKHNPWLQLSAVVAMLDRRRSPGVLRAELGVLRPGDVLRCALALARNEAEARRVLLTRLPTLEHNKLAGHTAGNLLLSMMEQYSG